MAIIGFSFSKFDCERKKGNVTGNIEINHAVNIENVEKTKLDVGGTSKTDVLKIEFKFDVNYGKGTLGHISIQGDVIFTDTKEIVEEVFKNWEANKKLSVTVNEEIYKFIYNKGIIRSVGLSDSLNLPAPIPVTPKALFQKKK